MRRAMVGLAVLIALVGGGTVAFVKLYPVHVPFVSDTCRVFAGESVVRLAPDQITHAATIVAVGLRRQAPERAVIIALATALQESKLRNLRAGDRDSVGLFQQRPSQGWGTPEEIHDPRYSAGKFYAGLLKVPGWQEMSVTDAAQAVQRSATPFAYAQWEADAVAITKAFAGAATGAVTCQLRKAAGPTGPDGVQRVVGEFEKDLGQLSVTARAADQPPGVSVAVGEDGQSTLGWRTAHWFVAKSHEHGIQRVAFAGLEWTADSGRWQKRENATGGQVEVRLAPAA